MTSRNRYKVMLNELNPQLAPSQPVVYQIRLKGHLGSRWADWFEGLTITLEEDGDALLTGPIIDQAVLHGLLKKVRDLGLPLISVNQVQFNETHPCYSKEGERMNVNSKTAKIQDRKVTLSTLWIFLSANYIYCDVLTHMDPLVIKELVTGTLGSIQIIPSFLLAAAIFMEIPFAMMILSRVLKYRVNRWVNIIAGAFMVASQVGTMNMGTPPTIHYLFYSAIEIACNLFIIWYAWNWTSSEG